MEKFWNERVWNERFWLPDGYTWEDFKTKDDGYTKPQFTELWNIPIIAVLLLCIRFIFERYIATPYCIYLGITDQPIHITRNSICEKVFYTVTKRPDSTQINGLAKQLGWTETKVNRWFSKKRRSMQVSLFKKATESCWRCVFYFFLFSFGAFTLLPTEWLYDTNLWMKGYLRKQDFNVYLKSYYLLELSFYTSLLFSQFIDSKRKDFYQMFLHHIVTIMLIFSSYAIGQFRIGVVIMFIHDAADYWLEAAKVFNYAKRQKLCDGFFVAFAIVFLLTRWVYYPFWVLHCMIVLSWRNVGPFPSYYYFTTLLCILQVLHIYWGLLITQMVYKFTTEGKVDKDTRSEGESSSDEMTASVEPKKKK